MLITEAIWRLVFGRSYTVRVRGNDHLRQHPYGRQIAQSAVRFERSQ